eukprot:2410495-Amphidinium_carterae.1
MGLLVEAGFTRLQSFILTMLKRGDMDHGQRCPMQRSFSSSKNAPMVWDNYLLYKPFWKDT